MGGFECVRPSCRVSLRAFLREELDIAVPERAIIEGHQSPLDYLVHTFFEGELTEADRPRGAVGDGEEQHRPPPIVDCIVWANRGGGKTMLGAVATLLDLVFKDGIQIRILGGSLDQSQRMHEHLRRFFEIERFAELLGKGITDRRIALSNGSVVELLAQSQTSVRGTRVQKLRCDEVELFDREVWEAAQLVTRSRVCGGVEVRGAIECLSTMHRTHGLMHELVLQASEGKRRLFKWGVVDALEHCEEERRCEPCAMRPECDGRAKERPVPEAGHIGVDDALRMKMRVALATWEAEMLCLRPSKSDNVLPEFDAKIHVVADLPDTSGMRWIGGMDFGMRAPAVVLWAAISGDGVLWIGHERYAAGAVMDEHIDAILDPSKPRLEWIAVDPAGNANNGQSGVSDATLMQRRGLAVRFNRSEIQDGVRRIRARLRPADGTPPRLYVHARCVRLIESMERYSYSPGRPDSEAPVKGDGFDHAIDALRYMLIELEGRRGASAGSYTVR